MQVKHKSVEKEVNGKNYRMGIKFEYTVKDTPQQNWFTEVAIATMANRERAMINRANLPEEYR